MSHGSLGLENPHGQGRSAGSRAQDALGVCVDGTSAVETVWQPQLFQEKVLACVRGLSFAVGGVGSGKSEAGALGILEHALRMPRRKDGTPTVWFVVGPEFALIRDQQFSKILNHCKRLKGLGYGSIVRRVVSGQDPRIVLANGQILLGRSGDQYARMEGPEVDGFWQDEAQRQPEAAFQTAVQRCRSSDGIRGFVTASPEDSPGWLWRMISGDESYSPFREKMLKLGGVRIFRWTSRINNANEGDVLDAISAVLSATSASKSAQKIGGRFPGTPEAPSLSVLNYVRAFIGKAVLRGEEARPAVLGVDLGETFDFTWLTVLSAKGVVLYMERFNAGSPGVPRADFYPWAQDRIEELATRWRVGRVVIDSAKAGKPLVQALERKQIQDITFEAYGTDTVGKKAGAIESLSVALSRGDVRIPSTWTLEGAPEQAVGQVAQLRKEFEDLIVKESEGKRSFDHPKGGHDDGIVSLALAWHGISQSSASGGQLADLYMLLPAKDSGPSNPFGGARGGRYTF